MRNLTWLLLTGVILLGAAGASAAMVSDVATDFSATNNPNGNWAYGTLDSSLTWATYGTAESAAADGSTFSGWHDADWDVNGNLGKNLGPNPIDEWGWYGEVGQIIMGSPTSGCGTTARWTAPADMLVDISAVFTGQRTGTGGTSAYVYVFLNNTNLFQGHLDGFIGRGVNGYTDGFGSAPSQSYGTASLAVSAGDVIYFAMDAQGFGGHATGLAATITEVPEPATMSLLALGSLGMVIRRKR